MANTLTVFSNFALDFPAGNASAEDIYSMFSSMSSQEDKNAALRLITGNTPKKIISQKALANIAEVVSGYPEWLVTRSFQETGSAIQALALLMSPSSPAIQQTLAKWLAQIENLEDEEAICHFISSHFQDLSVETRIFTLQLMTGSFRRPADDIAIDEALAKLLGTLPTVITLRRYFATNEPTIKKLSAPLPNEELYIPDQPLEMLPWPAKNFEQDQPENWQAFRELPGINATLVFHGNSGIFWNENGRVLNDKFEAFLKEFPSCDQRVVIQGKIRPDQQPGKLPELLAEIKKKTTNRTKLSALAPVFEIQRLHDATNAAIDQLLLSHTFFRQRTSVAFSSWTELAKMHQTCRGRGELGMTLVHIPTGKQYFWKAAPASVCAALMYVELDSFSKNGLKSMTFGVWHDDALVPVARLDAARAGELAEQVRQFAAENTIEKFGPVRTVTPGMAVKLRYDRIEKAARRKSGVLLSGVHPASIAEISMVDTLTFLKSMLP